MQRLGFRRLEGMVLALVLAFAVVAAGCGGDDDDTANGNGTAGGATATSTTDNGNGESATPTEAANEPAGGSNENGGTINVGAESWTVVADGQCSVFDGPVVYVWGHAAEDEDIEITIDYDPDGDLISAVVEGPDTNWSSYDDDISMELDGQTLRGEGTFTSGSGQTAEGAFEVSCS
jgi:hypothetical protein